jgi:D-glycero-D-manno-heptose 1,7-bisphosphate phosphatase
MKRKAIFLDRDGVLNDAIIREGKPFAPLSLKELTIAADAHSALQILKSAGFLLIAATNQPDVARGAATRADVDAINAKLMAALPLDEIRVCFHDNADNCHCRKPLPGMLLDAAKEYDIDLPNSFMIGDRWKDIEAGQRAGCKTILLNYDYQEEGLKHPADFVTLSLTKAAAWVIEHSSAGRNNVT